MYESQKKPGIYLIADAKHGVGHYYVKLDDTDIIERPIDPVQNPENDELFK